MITKLQYDTIQSGLLWSDFQISRVANQLYSLTNMTRDDLKQEMLMKIHEENPQHKLKSFVYNALRSLLRTAVKQPLVLSLRERGLVSSASSDVNYNTQQGDLYDHVIEMNILNDIDILVLSGEMTRHEAADLIGVSYTAYKLRLQRRMKKIVEKIFNPRKK